MGSEMVPFNGIIQEMEISSATRNRTIYFKEEFDRDSCFKLNYWLNRIKKIDDNNKIPLGERLPIEIVISSYGGVIYDGLSCISLIMYFKEKLKYKIITTVTSSAMSMGFLLSIIGSERRAYRYATLMTHQPSSWTAYELQKQIEDIAETQRLWDISKEIIINHTKITNEQLEDIKLRKFDWYMDSRTALDLGVIDEII